MTRTSSQIKRLIKLAETLNFLTPDLMEKILCYKQKELRKDELSVINMKKSMIVYFSLSANVTQSIKEEILLSSSLKALEKKYEFIRLDIFKLKAKSKLSKVGLLTNELEYKINKAETIHQVTKIISSASSLRHTRKVQKFKNAGGGSSKHLKTNSSLHTLSTPFGGQIKK